MSAVRDLLQEVVAATKTIRAVSSIQVESIQARSTLRELASRYFEQVRPEATGFNFDCSSLDATFEGLHSGSHGRPPKTRILDLLKKAKEGLVKLDAASVARPTQSRPSHYTSTDDLVISSLNDVCPSAGRAYQQALLDLATQDRLSWRGPATDLREALRETLDVLAPDDEVKAMPGFKLEGEARRPTMKQKVRFVLRSRGFPSGAMATPEHAVNGVEEIVGGLTRSIYDRSSISTHTATSRKEVVTVLNWVRMVLCELLEIPL